MIELSTQIKMLKYNMNLQERKKKGNKFIIIILRKIKRTSLHFKNVFIKDH